MSRRNESPVQFLVKMPWSASVVLGGSAFVLLRWVVPALWGGSNIFHPLATFAATLAPVVALAFGIIAWVSFLVGTKRQSLVDQQTSLESLREVSWKDFELLVIEAYRRQGYQVDYSLGKGADGGVDLVLRKDGRISFVQCKQWRVDSVGAPVIREQFGLMISEKADEAIIVTSGTFTRDAIRFAQGKPIHLVDGPRLLEMVKQVQGQPEFKRA